MLIFIRFLNVFCDFGIQKNEKSWILVVQIPFQIPVQIEGVAPSKVGVSCRSNAFFWKKVKVLFRRNTIFHFASCFQPLAQPSDGLFRIASQKHNILWPDSSDVEINRYTNTYIELCGTTCWHWFKGRWFIEILSSTNVLV